MKRKIVIAGSHQIYEQWLRAHGFRREEYSYACTAKALMGYRNVELIKLAGWFEKEGMTEAVRRLEISNARCL